MSTERLNITYAGQVYDRTLALYTGDVRPVGVNLDYQQMPLPELFLRQARAADIECSEYSLGAYLMDIGDSGLTESRLQALPIFPSKAFRHGAVYVNADSGVDRPEDLNGKRVGLVEWSITAVLWARGILSQFHQVDLRSIRWFIGGLETPGHENRREVPAGKGFDIEPIGSTANLNTLLDSGELDAVLTTFPPSAYLGESGKIRKLFSTSDEMEFFQKTGIFPPMHVVVVQQQLVNQFPWVPNNLFDAFNQARERALPRLLDNAFSTSSLVWEASYAEQERALMGDTFQYGVENNRSALELLCKYAFEQGLTQHTLEVEELFINSTLSTAKV